jgi:hypothetical protein
VAHFLLDTDPGSLVMVIVASTIVGFVVWWAIMLAVTGAVLVVLRLRAALRRVD